MGSSGSSGGTSSPLTTKGDVWGFSTTNARVPVGSDGTVLTARSSNADGVDWEAVAQASVINEIQAGVLINATSAGDAGGRADHFTGSALNAKWTVGAGTITVANSVASQAIGAASAYASQPYTPSGAFRIEARCQIPPGGQSCGIGVHDGGAGEDGTNGVFVRLEFGGIYAYKNVSNSITSPGNNQNMKPPGIWLYLALARDGSNNWTTFVSGDRVTWIAVTGSFALTFTVAALYTRSDSPLGSLDFVDVVS